MKQRVSTKEEYQKQINVIIEYINNHLDESIDLATLSDISNFSPYHFHRITRAFLGEPIGSYILRIRTETAAKLLRYTDLPIADIAYKIGYDTPSSLSKVFKQQYNISPTDYRNNKDFTLREKKTIDMELNIKKAKIVELTERQVIYIKLSGEYNSLDFKGTWKKLWQFVKENKLFSAGIEHLAIYYDDPKVTEKEKLRTDICLVIKKRATAKGDIGVKELKGGKYAMFLYQGSYNNLTSVYDTIYSKLLPENGFVVRNDHGFEKYISDPDRVEESKLKTEIYIPIEL